MANYCENYVELRGDKKNLDYLQARLEEAGDYESFNEAMDNVLINKLDPEEKADAEYFGTRFWDYKIERKSDYLLFLTGRSPWTAPRYLFPHLAEDYKLRVYFEYRDVLGDLNGKGEFHGCRYLFLFQCDLELVNHSNFKYIADLTNPHDSI